jgi:hypothetical protein
VLAFRLQTRQDSGWRSRFAETAAWRIADHRLG